MLFTRALNSLNCSIKCHRACVGANEMTPIRASGEPSRIRFTKATKSPKDQLCFFTCIQIIAPGIDDHLLGAIGENDAVCIGPGICKL